MTSFISHVISCVVSSQSTFTVFISLLLSCLIWVSSIRVGPTGMVRSSRTCTLSDSNTLSRLAMYFLNCETWNTLCKLARWGGKAISYVAVPILRVIWYGPINLGVNFLDLRTLPIPVVGVTRRNHGLLPQTRIVVFSYRHKTSAYFELLASVPESIWLY